ncbi:MAG: hypothetical protein LC803_17705 [Acidobacteria bacterium]|nr:hypothetical protein [Acidobacteriota bacterium]
MRRKFGILFLIGITVLAGTQEATRQFDGLKSSLKNFTRASLWSGLIVYAQPVSDGKLPTPQIYYLMPTPQQQQPVAPAAQQPILADNGANTTAKPDARNNHGGEAAAASNPDAVMLAATREIEHAAQSELILNKLPASLIASHFAPPQAAPQPAPHVVAQPERVRRYEEVAKNAPLAARKFKQDADVIAKVFVKELDDVKLLAETERVLVEEGQLERLKLKTLAEAANLHRRMELRVVRRPAVRPERLERVRVLNRPAETRNVVLPEMSSIGCEKTNAKPEPAPALPAAPLARTSAPMIAEPMVELGLPAASNAGSSWTLNCDTEPEQK